MFWFAKMYLYFLLEVNSALYIILFTFICCRFQAYESFLLILKKEKKYY